MSNPKFALIPSAYKNGNYPSVDGKIYSILPNNGSGDFIVFDRNSQAYKVNEQKTLELTDTSSPLIDHLYDCPSFVSERNSTNQLTYSEEITNPAWGTGSSNVYENETIAPNGELTGDRVEISDTSATGYIYRTLTLSTNQWKSFSVFVKNANNEQDVVYAEVWNSTDGTWAKVSIRFKDEQVTPSGTYLDYASVDNYSNGWYRLKLTLKTPSSFSGSNYFRIWGESGYGDSFYVWGAQEENNRNISSYIPTVSTTITRSGNDMAGATLEGYNKDEGVLYVDFEPQAASSTFGGPSIGIGLQVFGEYFSISSRALADDTTYLNFAVFIPYSPVLNYAHTIETRQRIKCAIVYRRGLGSPSGYYKVFVNGVLEHTQYASSFPVFSSGTVKMVLGSPTGNNTNTCDGRFYDFRYYDKLINDNEMRKLTTI